MTEQERSAHSRDALAERILAVRDRIALINTDTDRPSAQKDGPDLFWACQELREIAERVQMTPLPSEQRDSRELRHAARAVVDAWEALPDALPDIDGIVQLNQAVMELRALIGRGTQDTRHES